jgi:hypothetical protein
MYNTYKMMDIGKLNTNKLCLFVPLYLPGLIPGTKVKGWRLPHISVMFAEQKYNKSKYHSWCTSERTISMYAAYTYHCKIVVGFKMKENRR